MEEFCECGLEVLGGAEGGVVRVEDWDFGYEGIGSINVINIPDLYFASKLTGWLGSASCTASTSYKQFHIINVY